MILDTCLSNCQLTVRYSIIYREYDSLGVIPLENPGPGGLVVSEPVSVFARHLGPTARSVDFLEVGTVVAWPVRLRLQKPRHVLGVCLARNLNRRV